MNLNMYVSWGFVIIGGLMVGLGFGRVFLRKSKSGRRVFDKKKKRLRDCTVLENCILKIKEHFE